MVAQQLVVERKAAIIEMDTDVINSGNLVSLSDGKLAIREVQVDDFAHGEVVLYLDPSGEHGLITDTADLAADAASADGLRCGVDSENPI